MTDRFKAAIKNISPQRGQKFRVRHGIAGQIIGNCLLYFMADCSVSSESLTQRIQATDKSG